MKDIVPSFLQNLNGVHQNYEVIQNIKEDISMHLARSTKSHLVMAKTLFAHQLLQKTSLAPNL